MGLFDSKIFQKISETGELPTIKTEVVIDDETQIKFFGYLLLTGLIIILVPKLFYK